MRRWEWHLPPNHHGSHSSTIWLLTEGDTLVCGGWAGVGRLLSPYPPPHPHTSQIEASTCCGDALLCALEFPESSNQDSKSSGAKGHIQGPSPCHRDSTDVQGCLTKGKETSRPCSSAHVHSAWEPILLQPASGRSHHGLPGSRLQCFFPQQNELFLRWQEEDKTTVHSHCNSDSAYNLSSQEATAESHRKHHSLAQPLLRLYMFKIIRFHQNFKSYF